MTTIKASCPYCSDVELLASAVRAVSCSIESKSFYEFDCPLCHQKIRKPATQDIIVLLRSAGVESEVWIIPAEATEEHYGQAVNHDEVLDFALDLKGTDTLAALVGDTPEDFRW